MAPCPLTLRARDVMPDPLTPADAAIVAAYLAERGPTVCPAGAACAGIYDTPTVRDRVAADIRLARARAAAARRANEAKRPEIVRRRRAVAELVGLGRTAEEIARFLRVSASTVLNDISEMRRGG